MATSSRKLTTGSTVWTSLVQSQNAKPPAQTISLIRRIHIDHLPPISLRSSRRSKLLVIEAIQPARSWNNRSDSGGDGEAVEIKKPGAWGYAIGDQEIGGSGGHVSDRNFDRAVEVAVAAVATAALGVGNRVMYKLAVVPLKHYPFFLAQLSTFGERDFSLKMVESLAHITLILKRVKVPERVELKIVKPPARV